ncbi:MAG: hypothetical protein J5629_10390 [Muribaculaceae bacterium]|nr:hypothetical protein [Muribaculaceae bacterium]
MELKTLLAPQFNVDFDDLLEKGGRTVLDTPEIGLFFSAEVMRGEDSDKICFTSSALIITPELDNFIAFCTAILGNDIAGYGVITEHDHFMMNIKCFSRIWDGLYIHVRHDDEINIDELAIEITIKHDQL